jgi:glycosyltransferase involved in cell wall biosynthesis
MFDEPIQNDPTNPLLSIFICNYNGKYLKQCLDSIFSQNILRNIEIVLIDDATADGSWETAIEYSRENPGIMTIRRNRFVHGPLSNMNNCLLMAKGIYSTVLTGDQAFLPEYIDHCVKTMVSDPYVRFAHVFRTEDQGSFFTSHSTKSIPLPSIFNKPLVSILCYNYNYGRYLRQCLESVFAQTYENIELCFSDNASTDESWDIALEFVNKYPEKMFTTRNRKNFGPDANFSNCLACKHGKYYLNFCSDDVLDPKFVEHCVNALEAHPEAGLAIVNRAIIDEHNQINEEPPFYNQSCIIPGEEQAAVYMMAGVNPSVSQIMYRNGIAEKRSVTGTLVSRYYGTRILDFNIAIDFDIAYIKESLLMHRIHSQSDTSQADANLLPIIGLYVLNHQFTDIAATRGLKKVIERLPRSIDKLSSLAVRYSIRSLLGGDEQTAERYFYLAMVMSSKISSNPIWQKLREFWIADSQARKSMLDEFRESDNLVSRTISYDPPPGSIPIKTDS